MKHSMTPIIAAIFTLLLCAPAPAASWEWDTMRWDEDTWYDSGNDIDGDLLPDTWEMYFFGNLAASNGAVDSDGDGLSDLREFNYGTSPIAFDTDGDGISDGWEVEYGLNALYAGDAESDFDGDGFSNLEEFRAGTNPEDPLSKPAKCLIGILSIIME